MMKRLIVTTLLVCSVPALANAWTLTTKAASGGGNITGNGLTQTVLNGSVSKTYPGPLGASLITTADTGYTISKVTVNGAQVCGAPLAACVSPYSATVGSGTANANYSLVATFKADKLVINTSVNGKGSITPKQLSNVYVGQKAAQAITFRIIPKFGYNVGEVSVPAGFVVNEALPAATNKVVTVTLPAGSVIPAGTVAATIGAIGPVAICPLPQTVEPGRPVTLKGTYQNAIFQRWSSADGLFPTILGDRVTFTAPAACGTYSFLYRVAGQAGCITSITVCGSIGLQCANCHTPNGIGVVNGVNLPYVNFMASGHKTNAHGPQTCSACHVGADSGGHPGFTNGCASCHGPTVVHQSQVGAGATGTNCAVCHSSSVGNDAHAKEDTCISCHDIARNSGSGYVQDNNGVRAIMGEFNKRSHHITGAAPTDAQCIVCHMEGKASAYGVHTDATYHMKDDKIYLRNADTNAAIVWGGTEHTNMDNFCFSCHDADGALGIAAIKVAPGTTLMSATNPFGDTLTNSYDQVARTGVVDVKTAFTTTNASHHAVSGQRYVFRFSTVANATQWAARTGKPMPANSEIAELSAGYPNATINEFDPYEQIDPAGPHEGGAGTLYEADKFVYTYIPLGATQSVADNSTLHCGDCHTVGQWKVGSSTSADGSITPVAIGAHGSANDYLLRNSLGTDALHSSQTYVCFNCHKGGQVGAFEAGNDAAQGNGPQIISAQEFWEYSNSIYDPLCFATKLGCRTGNPPIWRAGWFTTHPNVMAGQVSGYATAHAVSAFHAQCQADSSAQTGSAGTPAVPVKSRVWYTTGGGHKDRTLDFIPAAGATTAVPSAASEGGNITGIGCTNCHNSGLRSGWGGIHGGNVDYIDGLGRSQKSYRFMPGMGNYRYAPPGGWDGKDVSDPTLVTQAGSGVGAGKPMGGCYTNSAADANNGFSSCAHHGTSTAQTTAGGQAAGFRTTYGGGTTATPTAVEPTVREATAGNSLVTRPLKY